MTLKGSLQTVSLYGIIQLLCNEHKSGILRVFRDREEYQIFYLEGSIIYAIESKKEARLGTLLIRDGLITAEKLKDCLQLARERRQAIGRILIDPLDSDVVYVAAEGPLWSAGGERGKGGAGDRPRPACAGAG